MGCISSKILTKSLSFREDLSHGPKRNRIANGIPMLDELFTSDDGTSGDHKSIPLVLEPQTGSFNSPPKSALEPTNVEMINTWELMAGLEEQVEQNDDYVQLEPCGASTMDHHYAENNVIDAEDPAQLLSRDIYSSTSGPEIKEMFPSNHNTIEESSSFKDVVVQERSIICDMGLKRKAVAKGLEPPQIPSAVELQSIGSLKEWLHGGGGGCVESPGNYVTPKFGNYDRSWSEFGEEWKEESILNPELLAACEEFIQQLELEEERILTKIEGNADKITGKDVSAEENKDHMLNDRNRPQFFHLQS